MVCLANTKVSNEINAKMLAELKKEMEQKMDGVPILVDNKAKVSTKMVTAFEANNISEILVNIANTLTQDVK